MFPPPSRGLLLLACIAALTAPALAQAGSPTFFKLPVQPATVVAPPHWIVVDSANNRIYSPGNVGESPGIAITDGRLNAVVGFIDLPQATGAGALDLGLGRLYVTLRLDGALAIIDLAENRVVETRPVGRGPVAVAVDPETHRVFVANTLDGTVSVLAAGGGIERTIAFPSVRGLEYDAERNELYVQLQDANEVVLVDAEDGGVLGTIELTPDAHFDFALNTLTRRLYATNFHDESLSVIDVDRALRGHPRATRIVPLGQQPWPLQVDELHDRVYVAEHEDGPPGTLWILDGKSNRVLHTVYLSVDGQDNGQTSLCYNSHVLGLNPVTRRAYVPCDQGVVQGILTVVEADGLGDLLPPT